MARRRKNAGNRLDQRAMTTMKMTTTTTKTMATATYSAMVLFMVCVLLTAAGQVTLLVEAAFVGLSNSCPPIFFAHRHPRRRQRGGCNLQSSSGASPEDLPENLFAAATTATTIVEDQDDDGEGADDDDDDDSWKTGFGKNTQYLSLTLKQHKPLGCTVEESLGSNVDAFGMTKNNKKGKALHYVFVTKVTEGGHAEKAGILPGDVIVGVTATFGRGEMENVAGLGIAKVKSLVAARPKLEPLQLRIARGTNVVQEHEVALAELCSNGAANDVEIENCVLEYLQSGYHDINTNNRNGKATAVQDTIEVNGEQQDEECDPTTSDEDCLLDQMYSMWADDMSVAAPSSNGKTDPTSSSAAAFNSEAPKKQVKPWSSRSSPSGTWVRDPKTGEMRNIDA